MATRFFSAGEIRELESWPAAAGRAELVRRFRMTTADVQWVHRSTRGAPNKVGLALQLCALPWLGFVPADVRAAPTAAVTDVAAQLGLEAGALAYYGHREQTRSDHLRLVMRRLGWRTADDDERAGWKTLREFLADLAIEHDLPGELFRQATVHLASDRVRIVRPGVVSLMEEVAAARKIAEREVFRRIEPLLTEPRLADLDGLLEMAPEMPMTRLAWLHRLPTKYLPTAIRAGADRLVFLRDLDVHTLDLSMIPDSRRRRLVELGRQLRSQPLRARQRMSKYPILLATVVECYAELLDELVEMFGQAMSEAENQVAEKRERLEEKWYRKHLWNWFPYRGPGTVDLISDGDPFTYLRRFAPVVLGEIGFAGSPEAQPLLQAVEILRALYSQGRLCVPDGAETSFLSWSWRYHLERAAEAGKPVRYRYLWEWSTLINLRDALRRGAVSVPGSRRHANRSHS